LPCHLWQPMQFARLKTAFPASVGSAADWLCAESEHGAASDRASAAAIDKIMQGFMEIPH
jgi:hypothetical protein